MKIINTIVLKIKGLRNQDEAREIAIALEEAGYNFAIVDQDSKELIIPQDYLKVLDKIKNVIEDIGRFQLQYAF